MLAAIWFPADAHERPSVTCPKQVSPPQVGFTPPTGWQVWPMPQVQPLDGGQVIEGQIETYPFADLEDSSFQPTKDNSYWIFCSYHDTALKLVHKIPVTARSCRLSGNVKQAERTPLQKLAHLNASPLGIVCR